MHQCFKIYFLLIHEDMFMNGKAMPKGLLTLPSLNWQDFNERYQSNLILGEEVLKLFLDDLAKDIAVILINHKNKNYKQMLFEVHKLRGASLYACTTRLSAILRQTEGDLKSQNYDNLNQFVSYMSHELIDIANELKNKPPI